MYEGLGSTDSPSYNRGDIVWVKLSGYWWPGEVINKEDLASDLLANFKKVPLAIVKFFDEDSYEYVRNWTHIYPYNCEKKNEFIKKGMVGFRSKQSHMAKFPKDVGTAEDKTNGNPNILSEPEFLPVKKVNYNDIFGSPSPKKIKGKLSVTKKTPSKETKAHITHRRFLGHDDYQAFICVQYPGKDRNWDSDEEEIRRLNEEPDKEFTCQSCTFKTCRLEVMILHTKLHIKGVYITSRKKTKKPREVELSDSETETIVRSPPKPKQRKRKEVKPKTDVFSDLLGEWDDTDEEEKKDETSTQKKQEKTKTNSDIGLETEVYDKNIQEKDDIVYISDDEHINNEKPKDRKDPLSSRKYDSFLEAKPSTVSKNTQEDIKNCFDFDEEEEEEEILLPSSLGRKIPRVIPEKPKPSISELLEESNPVEPVEFVGQASKHREELEPEDEVINKEEILKTSESFNRALNVDEHIESAFKELLEETEIPDVEEFTQTLKPEQNFHDGKTIKFPDKGGTKKNFVEDVIKNKEDSPKKNYPKEEEEEGIRYITGKQDIEEKQSNRRRTRNFPKIKDAEEEPHTSKVSSKGRIEKEKLVTLIPTEKKYRAKSRRIEVGTPKDLLETEIKSCKNIKIKTTSDIQNDVGKISRRMSIHVESVVSEKNQNEIEETQQESIDDDVIIIEDETSPELVHVELKSRRKTRHTVVKDIEETSEEQNVMVAEDILPEGNKRSRRITRQTVMEQKREEANKEIEETVTDNQNSPEEPLDEFEKKNTNAEVEERMQDIFENISENIIAAEGVKLSNELSRVSEDVGVVLETMEVIKVTEEVSKEFVLDTGKRTRSKSKLERNLEEVKIHADVTHTDQIKTKSDGLPKEMMASIVENAQRMSREVESEKNAEMVIQFRTDSSSCKDSGHLMTEEKSESADLKTNIHKDEESLKETVKTIHSVDQLGREPRRSRRKSKLIELDDEFKAISGDTELKSGIEIVENTLTISDSSVIEKKSRRKSRHTELKEDFVSTIEETTDLFSSEVAETEKPILKVRATPKSKRKGGRRKKASKKVSQPTPKQVETALEVEKIPIEPEKDNHSTADELVGQVEERALVETDLSRKDQIGKEQQDVLLVEMVEQKETIAQGQVENVAHKVKGSIEGSITHQETIQEKEERSGKDLTDESSLNALQEETKFSRIKPDIEAKTSPEIEEVAWQYSKVESDNQVSDINDEQRVTHVSEEEAECFVSETACEVKTPETGEVLEETVEAILSTDSIVDPEVIVLADEPSKMSILADEAESTPTETSNQEIQEVVVTSKKSRGRSRKSSKVEDDQEVVKTNDESRKQQILEEAESCSLKKDNDNKSQETEEVAINDRGSRYNSRVKKIEQKELREKHIVEGQADSVSDKVEDKLQVVEEVTMKKESGRSSRFSKVEIMEINQEPIEKQILEEEVKCSKENSQELDEDIIKEGRGRCRKYLKVESDQEIIQTKGEQMEKQVLKEEPLLERDIEEKSQKIKKVNIQKSRGRQRKLSKAESDQEVSKNNEKSKENPMVEGDAHSSLSDISNEEKLPEVKKISIKKVRGKSRKFSEVESNQEESQINEDPMEKPIFEENTDSFLSDRANEQKSPEVEGDTIKKDRTRSRKFSKGEIDHEVTEINEEPRDTQIFMEQAECYQEKLQEIEKDSVKKSRGRPRKYFKTDSNKEVSQLKEEQKEKHILVEEVQSEKDIEEKSQEIEKVNIKKKKVQQRKNFKVESDQEVSNINVEPMEKSILQEETESCLPQTANEEKSENVDVTVKRDKPSGNSKAEIDQEVNKINEELSILGKEVEDCLSHTATKEPSKEIENVTVKIGRERHRRYSKNEEILKEVSKINKEASEKHILQEEAKSCSSVNEDKSKEIYKVVKKCRGRPRKYSKVESDQEASELNKEQQILEEEVESFPLEMVNEGHIQEPVVVTSTKGRGRPRKLSTVESNQEISELQDEHVLGEEAKFGSSEKRDELETQEVEGVTTAVKKCRGRPRKYSKVESDQEASELNKEQQILEEEVESFPLEMVNEGHIQEPVVVTLTKGRGRPRKLSTVESNQEISELQDEHVLGEEAKFGSSEKRDELETQEVEGVTTAVKKCRGRPRKYSKVESDQEASELNKEQQILEEEVESFPSEMVNEGHIQETVVVTSTKGRGRPRKLSPVESNQEVSELQDEHVLGEEAKFRSSEKRDELETQEVEGVTTERVRGRLRKYSYSKSDQERKEEPKKIPNLETDIISPEKNVEKTEKCQPIEKLLQPEVVVRCLQIDNISEKPVPPKKSRRSRGDSNVKVTKKAENHVLNEESIGESSTEVVSAEVEIKNPTEEPMKIEGSRDVIEESDNGNNSLNKTATSLDQKTVTPLHASNATLDDFEIILPLKKSRRINDSTSSLEQSFTSNDSMVSCSLRDNIEKLVDGLETSRELNFFSTPQKSEVNDHSLATDGQKDIKEMSDKTVESSSFDNSVKEDTDMPKCVPPKKKKLDIPKDNLLNSSYSNESQNDSVKVEETTFDEPPQPPKKKLQKLFENSMALEKLNDMPLMSPLAKKKSFSFQQSEFEQMQPNVELLQKREDDIKDVCFESITIKTNDKLDLKDAEIKEIPVVNSVSAESRLAVEGENTSDKAICSIENKSNANLVEKARTEVDIDDFFNLPKKRKKRKSSFYGDPPEKKKLIEESGSEQVQTKEILKETSEILIKEEAIKENLPESVPLTCMSVIDQPVKEDHKNEMEVKIPEEDFQFSIQTNLSNFTDSKAEELSAIALEALSEIKHEAVLQKSVKNLKENGESVEKSFKIKDEKDLKSTDIQSETNTLVLPMPEKIGLPSEPELVPIEGNLTVMSENDLADAQVEITTDKVISEKKPMTLGTFSMDFSESGNTDFLIQVKKKIVPVMTPAKSGTQGTEFTTKAMTKQFDNKPLVSQSKHYEKSELLDILEGNSNSNCSTNSSGSDLKFRQSYDNYDKKSTVQGMFDFEEAIPSQIVLTNKIQGDSVLLESPKLLERLSGDKPQVKSQQKVVIQSDIKVTEGHSRTFVSKTTKPFSKPTHKIIIKTSKTSSGSSTSSGNKPIILSEQIIRPANAPTTSKPVQNQGVKRQFEDIEDIETAFIIPKVTKKAAVEEEVIPTTLEKPTGRGKNASKNKAKILQQTIITPKGEIIQPQTAASQPTQLVLSDDTVFDINSMPIVISDDLLTPESIESMPVVLSEDVIPQTTTLSSKSQEKVLPTLSSKKVVTTVVPKQQVIFKTTTGATLQQIAGPTSGKQLTKPRILSSATAVSSKISRPNALLAAGTTADGKPAKYVLVPSTVSSGLPQGKAIKQTIVKKQPGLSPKLPNVLSTEASSVVGNKIMIVTNQQGQQHRLLLTPQQQKMLGMQGQPTPKVTKTIVKGAIPKSLLESAAAGPSGMAPKSPISTLSQAVPSTTSVVSSQGGLLMPVGKSSRTSVQSKRPSQKSSVTHKPQKTILIKNQHGHTVRKIQGTDDAELDRQVAEQLEAIKASARLQQCNKPPEIINYTNRPIPANQTKPLVKRTFSKKTEHTKAKPSISTPQTSKSLSEPMIPALAPISTPISTSKLQLPNRNQLPQNTSLPQSVKKTEKLEAPVDLIDKSIDAVLKKHIETSNGENQAAAAPPVSPKLSESKQDRPLNQLVIQDALGNQTTITEGQILALPSETVDGQPQSYMLVTLDESGNLTPLNNEALMSLDPSLGLGGDINNMVLQVDQGQGIVAAIKPAEGNEVVPIISEQKKVEESIASLLPEQKEPLKSVQEPKPVIKPPELQEVPLPVETQVAISEGVLPGATDPSAGGQQLIVTGDPIATQKFLESLSEGTTDLANILANAEGGSILIQADGQQILIKTNTGDDQALLGTAESTEGGGNPIFATHKPNQDILAAALADTDVFQPSELPTISPSPIKGLHTSQLSPGSGVLYPMHVGNVLETSLTLSSPIMTPLEVPSTNSKKIDEADILNQVPKNVDLPITITDPNISQTVAQQAVGLLDLALPISETTTAPAIGNSSYSYSLPTLDETVEISPKPFNGSMPLLTEDVEESSSSEKGQRELEETPSGFYGSFSSIKMLNEEETKNDCESKPETFERLDSMPMITEEVVETSSSDMTSTKSPVSSPKSSKERAMDDEGLCTLGGEMCSSLSEPPPDMFELGPVAEREEEISSDMSSVPEPEGETLSLNSEGSGEIPLQPQIIARLSELKRPGEEIDNEQEEKRQKND